MTNLTPMAAWDQVPQLELTDVASGGPNGTMNKQAKALANRDELLAQQKADVAYVDEMVAGVSNGLAGSYKTYALLDAAKATLPANSSAKVTNDPDPTKNGEYDWDGTTLTKSAYDPVQQAKNYTDQKVDGMIYPINDNDYALPFVDDDGWVYGGFGVDGSFETPLFKITSETPSFLVMDEDGWILLEQSLQQGISKDWANKKVMLFGDSITETSNVEAGIYDSLAYRSNWFLYAYAMLEVSSFRNFARSGASYREYVGQLDWQKISHQIATSISNGFTPDIIVISCGTNDGVSNLGDYDVAMSKSIASLDMAITAEAMRKNFHTISQSYPDAKVYSCLPLQRADDETSVRQPLIDLITKMSKRYGFKVIDCHGETGIVKDFEIWGSSGRDLYDGLHPKTSGQIKQAKTIAASIKATYQITV